MTISSAEFLAHYASEFYDPVKAHEYYLKNRELKGQKAAPLSKTQTEGLAYAKNEIKTKRKADLEGLDKAQKAKLEKIQADADAAISKISKTLDDFFAKLNGRLPTRGELKKIAFLQEQQKKTRKRIATSVQTAVKNAREEYSTSRRAVQEKYATAATTEDANIRAKVR